MHISARLAFRSPLHARALPNLEGRALKAMRSVGLDSGTLRTSYHTTLPSSTVAAGVTASVTAGFVTVALWRALQEKERPRGNRERKNGGRGHANATATFTARTSRIGSKASRELNIELICRLDQSVIALLVVIGGALALLAVLHRVGGRLEDLGRSAAAVWSRNHVMNTARKVFGAISTPW